MTRRFLVTILLAACNAAPTANAPTSAGPVFAWPTPAGWKAETIPFPLEFAPELHYRGVEEVRFAPHFFEPPAETYFSYSFAWILDDVRPVPSGELAESLRVYFAGLARAVGGEKHVVYEPSLFSAHVEATDAARSRGTVTMVDAFGDGRKLTLNLDAVSSVCGDHRVVLVALSPQPAPPVAAGPADAARAVDGTWGRLLEQRRTFRCLGRGKRGERDESP